MPIVSVTPLGSDSGGTAAAVGQIIDYLERGSRAPERNAAIVGYYADTPTSAGVWRGRGVNGHQLTGPVDADTFRTVLEGRHPVTGEQLVSAAGSAGRATREGPLPVVSGDPQQLFTVDEAAALLGVTATYLRRLALATEQDPATRTPLHGVRDEANRWQFTAAELDRFAAARTEPKVVIAYDVTVSFEKSISLAWARATPEQREVIEAALDAGTNAAIAYLEDHAVAVRRGRSAAKADGVWAASYRHLTNRNLEPQLHDHVVIANVAAADGRTQTLDSRLLHHHAKTAGYIAGAVTRHELSARLGVAWQPAQRGLADLDGITRPQIAAFSTRRAELTTLTDELGLDSAAARAVAAKATRAPKTAAADWQQLEARWQAQLDTVGLTADRWASLQGRHRPRALRPADTDAAIAWLDSPAGVTRANGVFSRRDVVQALVDWDARHGGGTRLTYDDIDRVTDTYLASDRVVPIRVGAAQITRSGETAWFTTPEVLDLEQAVIAAYTHARHPLPPAHTRHVDAAITTWEHASGNVLGADQAAMVAAITTRTDRFQAVVGPAGSGKTTAVEIAARILEAAGYQPLGASVTGTATEVLEEATGVPSRTVSSLVHELQLGHQPFTAQTVLIVDEASTLSNRDHHRLVTAVDQAGARMVTIGDPAQHRAVDAGGLWAHLLDALADRVPQLTVNRRQAAPAMTDVALAVDEYRHRHIAAALARLDTNQRIVTAPSTGELLDHLAADWYVDHHHARQHGDRPSRMMADTHTLRRELNSRAQALLRADGTLTGPGTNIAGERFHVGDDVITRTQDRQLRFPDGRILRNGTTGTITAITTNPAGQPELTVDFHRRGTLHLPHEFLTRPLRPGIDGGLAPAYAVTTHAAQGATYRTGRTIATDTSSREGIYVGLTRATTDTRLYLVASPTLGDSPSDIGLPILRDQRPPLEALTAHLNAPDPAAVIAATDPDARTIHLLRTHTLDQLRADAGHDRLARHALTSTARAAARLALHDTPPELVERFGPRPPTNSPLRAPWDDTITRLAEHHITATPTGTGPAQQRAHAQLTASIERLDLLRAAHADEPLEPRPTAAADLKAEIVELADRLRSASSTLPIDHRLVEHLTDQLDHHAIAAVERPAPYLIAVLGTRPDGDDDDAQRWDDAALTIETHRHRHGFTPDDGPFTADTDLERATGPIDDPIEALAIDRAVAAQIAGPTRALSAKR